jgi:predicted tellurium resistance membrane protein TerC
MSPTVTPTRISGLGSIFSDPNTNDESGPDPSVMVTAIIMIVLVLLAALGLLIYLLQRRKYLRGGWAKKR